MDQENDCVYQYDNIDCFDPPVHEYRRELGLFIDV
jgi:hypothetical protein